MRRMHSSAPTEFDNAYYLDEVSVTNVTISLTRFRLVKLFEESGLATIDEEGKTYPASMMSVTLTEIQLDTIVLTH